jgi:hypothetical protein
MKIFAEHRLSEFLEQRRQAVVREIQSEQQDHLLNVNEADYLKYLVDKYHVEPLTFAFDAIRASSAEKLVPAEAHPPLFNVRAGQSYSRHAITFHVPFTGEPELLQRAPSTRIDWTCDVMIIADRPFPLPRGEGQGEGQTSTAFSPLPRAAETQSLGENDDPKLGQGEGQTASEIQFDLINWRDDREALDRDKKRILDSITEQNAYVTEEVTQFNSRLEDFVRQTLSGRKSQLLTRLTVTGSLGVPLQNTPGLPQTFAVPIVPKKLVVKPSAPASSRAFPSPSGRGGRGEGQTGTQPPDPTLDNETYQDILSIIHGLGVAMERHPSTYADKHEQDLRDLLLATLSTHYPSSTGETFNKKGRTDILVRHQASNVFVAECKFWAGLKAFHATIDQLLSYLTWRDSKAALICFVQNTQLGPVLQLITTGAPQHPCFIRIESTRGESWMQCEFRLPSDPTRNVHLTVLSFHFPPAWIDDM